MSSVPHVPRSENQQKHARKNMVTVNGRNASITYQKIPYASNVKYGVKSQTWWTWRSKEAKSGHGSRLVSLFVYIIRLAH